MMQPYQQRVVDEKAELEDRLTALTSFIDTLTFTKMLAEDKWLLVEQRRHMLAYAGVLAQRIDRFNLSAQITADLSRPREVIFETPDCPHAAPHRYCAQCAVSPCPIGLGKL